MNHYASPEFWDAYRALPANIQRLADRCYEQLRRDERYPSLQLKKVGRFYSARVGIRYRAVGIETTDGIVWFWIGPHSEYDKIIR
ncbi:MAG TPA: hypothetical protein VE085_05230 [Burkholderiales bacterium]|nr:hypothetical protein [Burkholderiales bacterium]